MKVREFAELPAIEDMSSVGLKVGMKFLTGLTVIAQQESKKVGQEICYYIVTDADVRGKDISYKPVYDKLEE